MDRATNPLRNTESRALTGLRGLGALLVIVHHLYLHLDHGPHPAIDGLLRRGYMGVDLFFVLSGFVLSLAYGSWFDGTFSTRLRAIPTFLIRRIARLWPLHAAMLITILALGGWGPHQDFTTHALLANAVMIQAWDVSLSINPPTWSISAELLAYLIFPALALPLLRSRSGLLLGPLSVVLILGITLHFTPPLGPGHRGLLDIYQNYSPLPVLRCLAGFILGMLTWRASQTLSIARGCANSWTGPMALLAFLGLLLGGVNDLLPYLLLPIIVLGMHFGKGPMVRTFAQGPIHRLGVLSYAVYVIHFTLLYHFPFDWAPQWLGLLAFFAATLGLATCAHIAIESPGRSLIRRIGRGSNPDRALCVRPLQRRSP